MCIQSNVDNRYSHKRPALLTDTVFRRRRVYWLSTFEGIFMMLVDACPPSVANCHPLPFIPVGDFRWSHTHGFRTKAFEGDFSPETRMSSVGSFGVQSAFVKHSCVVAQVGLCPRVRLPEILSNHETSCTSAQDKFTMCKLLYLNMLRILCIVYTNIICIQKVLSDGRSKL
jgi:hypothetical protein